MTKILKATGATMFGMIAVACAATEEDLGVLVGMTCIFISSILIATIGKDKSFAKGYEEGYGKGYIDGLYDNLTTDKPQ